MESFGITALLYQSSPPHLFCLKGNKTPVRYQSTTSLIVRAVREKWFATG